MPATGNLANIFFKKDLIRYNLSITNSLRVKHMILVSLE